MSYFDLNVIGADSAERTTMSVSEPDNFGFGDIPLPVISVAQNASQVSQGGGVTAEDVARIVAGVVSELKVYVVEADITQAQNSVRAVVEQANF